MRLVFTDHGWQEYQHWVTSDRRTVKRLNRLNRARNLPPSTL